MTFKFDRAEMNTVSSDIHYAMVGIYNATVDVRTAFSGDEWQDAVYDKAVRVLNSHFRRLNYILEDMEKTVSLIELVSTSLSNDYFSLCEP